MTIGRHLPERLITVAIEAGPGGGGDSGGDGGGGGVLAVTSDHTPETVLFLVDCSGSMGEFGRFQAAISRVVDELGRLNRRERVYAWLFGDRINRFCGQVSSGAPVVLTNNSKDKIVEWMLGATPSGGENVLEALSEALLVAPDVLYLVTDGDFVYDMSRMTQLLREGNTRVVGIGVAPVTDVFQEFVVQTGGQFDVMYDFVLNVNREQLSNASNRTKTSVAARLRRARHFEAQGKVVASRRLVLELAFGYPGSPEAHMAISMLRHECAMGLESEISENDAK